MFKYLINGELFEFSTEEQKEMFLGQAREKGFSIELVEDEVETDFQNDSVEDVDTVSEIATSEDMDSTLENGSSDFQSPDNKEEDFDFIDDAWSTFVISLKSVASTQSRIPTFLNELKYSAAKMFLSDEDKEVLNGFSPEMEQVLANSMSFGTNDLMSGELAKEGNKYYEESQVEIEKLNNELQQFDSGIVEDIIENGNIGRGLARGFSAAIGSLPSVFQAMVPGIGIASIVAGSAAQASAEAQKKGKDLDMNTMLYSGVIGAAEGLLELTTKRIGTTMFKSLAGKSKEVITKSVKEMVLGVAKDAGLEGLSEGSTEAIKMIADAVYLGEKKTLDQALYQFADAFLIGGMMGGGMSGVGSGRNMLRNIGQGKKVKNNLNQTEYETLIDAYKTKETTKFLPVLSADENTEKFLNTELKNKVSKGDITIEESNVIKENFQSSQQAVNSLKNEGIKPEFMSNELVDAAENVFALDKKFNSIDKKINKNLAKEVGEEIDLADQNLGNLISKSKTVQTTEETLGKFKNLAEDFELNVTETDQKEADVLLGKAKGKKLKIEESAGYGFIYTDENNIKQVVLNKEAIYEDGMINTGAHEFLHYALSQGLKSTKDIKAISDSLMDLIGSSTIIGNKSQYDARVKQYQADFDKKEISAETFAEEKLVLLSEALLNGDFKITEDFKDKLNNIVRRLLSTIGVRAKFNNSQDALNFVKDYNRSMTKGRLTRGQKNTIREGARGSMVTANVVNKATQEIKTSKTKPKSDLKESKTLTLEQLKEKAEDLLEEANLDSSNPDLLDRYFDAIDAIDAMEDTESNESAPIAKQEEKKQIAKDDTPQLLREKKDRSTKRYTLTDEQKAEIEPLIAKAQILNKELIAKEKAATDARIKKITDKSERQMSRTDQAKAIADIKANPTRYSKSAELTNLENKIQEKVKVPLAKLINAYTKRLYDGIPAQAKEIVSREDYQTEAKAVVITTLINEFKKNTTNRLGEKTTNDIEDLMFNRGYFRMLPLATAMGVSSKVEGIAQRFDNVANNIGTEDVMFDEKNNEPEMIMEGKFKISSLLASIDRYKQAMATAIAFWKENEGNSPIENFKNLPGFTAEILGEMFGIPAKIFDKRLSRSPNLNNKVYKSAMDAITKPYAVFKITRNGVVVEERVEVSEEKAFAKKLTEDGFEFEQLANQNILQTLFKFLPQLSAEDYNYAINNTAGRSKGKSTGVPKNIMKLAFTNKQRRTTGTGNVSGDLRRLSYKEVLDGIGGFINEKGEAQVKMGIDAKSPEGQTFIGVMRVLNRMVANELSRSSLIGLDPMTVKDIAAGKNDLMESKRKKVLNQKSVIEVIKINEFIKDTATNKEIEYLQNELDKFFVKSKGQVAVIEQIKFASNLAKKKWGPFGKGLFNNEFKYNLEKLSAKDRKEFGLDDISKALGKAWGRTFNYIVRFKGLKKELDQLNEYSTKEDIETFILVFGRSLKNSKYEGTDRKAITTNKSLFEEINQKLGSDQSLENLGFELDVVPIRNKDGKIVGERSFIYDISGEERRLVNPALTVLNIKNKAFNSMGVIGPQVLDISDLYRNAIKRVLKEYKTNGDIEGGYAAIEAMFFGQVSAGRRIATLRKAYNFKGKATLEHVTSVDLTKPILRKFLEGGSETVYDAELDKLFVDVIPADLDKLLRKIGLEGRYDEKFTYNGKETTVNELLKELGEPAVFDVVKARENINQSKRSENAVKAVSLANNAKTPVKGISVWDFDDTLAQTKSNVLYTMPNGTKGKLTAEEFARTGDRLSNEGAIYDFSEFSKVMNGKKGPMFAEAMARNKKFGNKNVYILTARPANSATAIHTFLKGLGLNIPVENITGLANSSPLAKADWVVEKAAEGYNNFYFADDHIGNVEAVQKVLNVLDVKNKVHQAVVNESKKLKKQYSAIIAKRRGGMTITDAEASSGYIEQQIDNSFEYMEGAVKDGALPEQELSKAKKMGLHFLANSPIKFPEDGYKIIDALSVATKNKVDPFTFKNVDVLLSKYVDSKSLKPMDPNSEKEFTNKSDVPGSDITVFDVATTRAGQEAVRKAVDTNWGVKANPWCVIARVSKENDNVIDFWDTAISTNVDSQFAVWNTVYPDGDVIRESANQAGVQNRNDLTWAEREELTVGKKSRPGVIKITEQVYDDEVNQDDGRVGILTYQEWIVLSDPNQTKEEFEAGGGILYPPEPAQLPITKEKPKMKPDLWNMYGEATPPLYGVIGGKKRVFDKGSAGGWKIAFKGGKLLGLRNLGTDNQSWWDRMDRPSDDLSLRVFSRSLSTYTTINTKTGKEKTNKVPVIKESKKVDKLIDNIVNSDTVANSTLATPATMATGSLDGQFNKFLEGSTGIESFKRYKSDKAKLKGRYKGKFDAFIPPSAEDFLGLLYQTLNKGKQGEAQLKFYEDNLLKPYAKANSALRTARVRSIREFDAIKKKLKIVPKDLKRSFKFEDENGNMKDSLFTKEQAIRVYIWNSQGIEMPNLSQVDLAVMVNEVNANPDLKAFADELLKLNRGMDSKAPSKNWMDGNIGIDLQANLNSVGRKQLLEVWQQNVDEIFSEENLNKLEASYGSEYVKALESSLRRMRTGRSTVPVTDNAAGNNLIMWLNSAVGNIMFFNSRSALLQMLSATNFLNFEENNIIAAGKALMNIKQYSKDFVMLMNSDYLVDRRDGTRININEADIALIAKQSGITGVIAKILEAGFLPTKYADSLAIGIGGATFYRTKVDALRKGGMSKDKAEAQAMQEFVSVAETSQQSSDQSKISMEQSGSVGKIILAFNNTSSQYSRIIKRAVQDLYNRRGSDKANLARIVYYGGMQNLLFNFMQQAMFAAMWGGEDDEEVLDGKKAKIVNSMADGLLRGMGVKAAIFVAIKNTAIKLLERSEKKRGQNYKYYAVTGMLALSPPLSSKSSKLARAADAFQYGKDEMKYGELSLDSPELTIGANMISFATSLPTDRLLTKAINVSDALDASNEPWERLFMLMGWPKWTMSTKAESDLERKEDKAKIKAAKEGEEFKKLTAPERRFSEVKDLKKAEQVDILIKLGFSKKQIRLMKKEEDRINAIIKEQNKNKRKKSLK